MSDPIKSPAMEDLMVSPESIKDAKWAPDRLELMFLAQRDLMDKFIEADKLPNYPIDITSKHGQRQIKELTWAMVEEMAEAS